MPDKMCWTEPPVSHYVRSVDLEAPGWINSGTVPMHRESVTVSLRENWWFESGLNGPEMYFRRRRAYECDRASARRAGYELRR